MTAGFLSVFVLLFAARGSSGLPLSIPPLPEDTTLTAAAPAECLGYLSWYGAAEPDADSTNQTEQLLADEEVQAFLHGVFDEIDATLRRNGGGEGEMAASIGLPLAKLVLTRPTAMFVSEVGPISAANVNIKAGLIVSGGDQAAELKRLVGQVEQLMARGALAPRDVTIAGAAFKDLPLPGPIPPVQWGFQGDYFVLAVGQGTAERIVRNLAEPGEPPAWLKQVHGRMPVARPAMVQYVNLSKIRDTVLPFLGATAPKVIEALGLENVEWAANVMGLDDTSTLTRSFIATSGEPGGVFKLISDKPLTAKDLRRVPLDATWAVVSRFDAAKVYQDVLDAIGDINPVAHDGILGEIDQMETSMGFRIQQDVLEPLGDVWSFYNSPGDGGLLVTGLIAMVEVRDPARGKELLGRINTMLRNSTDDDAVATFQSHGQQVYYLRLRNAPLAPAWCLTDDALVFGLYPQTIKAFLARNGKATPSLAKAPAVAAALKQRPAMLSYQDTGQFFRLLYPVLQAVTPVVSGELRRQEINFDTSLLPSATAIYPHLTPAVSTVTRHKDGVGSVSHESIPGVSGGLGAASTLMGFATPAYQSFGVANTRTQASNNLKQLGLAMHNFHDVYRALPAPASVDKDGKPLLSWRVHVLPFLEQQALYQKFHLDEPWDSEHNKKLIKQMPDVFKSPGGKKVGMYETCFLVPVGKDTLFPPSKRADGQGISFAQVTDGLSNTAMVVEAAPESAVIWTKPEEWKFDPKKPTQSLIGHRKGGFFALLGDGSVRFISENVNGENLRNLFMRNDGKPVDLNK